jgi:hypothetical protein
MVKYSPQRLAWLIMLASILTCCALAVGVPAAGMSFINSSTYVAPIDVKLQAGRTFTFSPPATEADARVVDQSGRTLEEGSTIVVDSSLPSQAFLSISEADGITDTLMTMQLYSGARVRIERARVPRFDIATAPIEIDITLLDGRVQIQNTQPADKRPLQLTVTSDQMTAVLPLGEYSFEVTTDETSVFVRKGIAQITSANKTETFNIDANQRTVVHKGEKIVPGAPPRDLIRDGHFQQPIGQDWVPSSEVYVPGDVTGTVELVGSGENTALLLDRPGLGLNWGRTGVKQIINANVSGRSSLQLQLNFTILFQELKVCGSQGSECPLMVRINYTTKDGSIEEWTQGFYADGTPQMPDLPDFIVQAAEPHTKHIAVRLGSAEPYESPNLMDTLQDVQNINWIQLYAEGHGLETQINSVQLLVLD